MITDLSSCTVLQHQQMLNWLSQEPCVDPDRIGFYGMSYGGKTALRVPPLLDRYALDICSGDFNDLVWVMTDVDSRGVFPFDVSYDLYEFNAVNVRLCRDGLLDGSAAVYGRARMAGWRRPGQNQ